MDGACAALPCEVGAASPSRSARRRRRAAVVAIRHAQRAACALSASLGLSMPMDWVEVDAGQGDEPGVWHIPAADTLHCDAIAWAAAAFADGVAAGCHIVPLLRGDDAEPEVSFNDFPLVDGDQPSTKSNQGSTQNAYETEVNSGDVLQILARWGAAQTTPKIAEPMSQGRMLNTFGTELSADGNLEADGAQVSIDNSPLVDGGQQSFKGYQGSALPTYLTEVSKSDVLQDLARWGAAQTTPKIAEPVGQGRMLDTFGTELSAGGNLEADGAQVSKGDVLQDLARWGAAQTTPRDTEVVLDGKATNIDAYEATAGEPCTGWQWWRARHEIADEWIFEIALAAGWARQDSFGPRAQPLNRALAMTRASAHKHPLLHGWVDYRTNRIGMGLQTWGHSAPMWGEGFFVNDMCPFGHRHFADDSLVVDDVLQKEVQLERTRATWRSIVRRRAGPQPRECAEQAEEEATKFSVQGR
ncbi:unnamed protein product [Prorocentrum cordatum]|uniref:Uncharacterized protein n=1 Tax=Prorocentrum cordatum TaxID=2364126 RepID=A0ABN9R7N1_9DINO|nr:unnamed protein product [Polarella glacialis]